MAKADFVRHARSLGVTLAPGVLNELERYARCLRALPPGDGVIGVMLLRAYLLGLNRSAALPDTEEALAILRLLDAAPETVDGAMALSANKVLEAAIRARRLLERSGPDEHRLFDPTLRLWYRAEGQGFTEHEHEAHLYSRQDAERIVGEHLAMGDPCEMRVAVPVREVPPLEHLMALAERAAACPANEDLDPDIEDEDARFYVVDPVLNMLYRGEGRGFTELEREAGRFTRAEAELIVSRVKGLRDPCELRQAPPLADAEHDDGSRFYVADCARNMFYRGEGYGFTEHEHEAGCFTRAEAERLLVHTAESFAVQCELRPVPGADLVRTTDPEHTTESPCPEDGAPCHDRGCRWCPHS